MPIKPLDDAHMDTINPVTAGSAASSEGMHITGEESFDSFGSSLPTDARSFLDDVTPGDRGIDAAQGEGSFLADTTVESPAEIRKKKVAVSRKWKKAMDKLKGKAASLPVVWFNNQAKSAPEWMLDDDERDMITESITTVFDVLDINIEIEPLSWTLTSVWWVISYPILVFSFLFLSKKSLVMEREQRESQQDNQ